MAIDASAGKALPDVVTARPNAASGVDVRATLAEFVSSTTPNPLAQEAATSIARAAF
jgi:hypothetical protein